MTVAKTVNRSDSRKKSSRNLFQEILGHNEDALSETLNHFYFVSAHIVCDKPQGRYSIAEEKFTSLCYAGTLPGFTMSYNHHGFVYSINIVSAAKLRAGKTRQLQNYPKKFIIFF